ncbi:unnamed protein product, partial [Polarella glacialis]
LLRGTRRRRRQPEQQPQHDGRLGRVRGLGIGLVQQWHLRSKVLLGWMHAGRKVAAIFYFTVGICGCLRMSFAGDVLMRFAAHILLALLLDDHAACSLQG